VVLHNIWRTPPDSYLLGNDEEFGYNEGNLGDGIWYAPADRLKDVNDFNIDQGQDLAMNSTLAQVSTNVIGRYVLHPWFVEYNRALRKLINPQGRKFTVAVGFPGADVANLWLATGFTKAYWIHSGMEEISREKFIEALSLWDKLKSDGEYFAVKFRLGWNGSRKADDHTAVHIIEELKAMGAVKVHLNDQKKESLELFFLLPGDEEYRSIEFIDSPITDMSLNVFNKLFNQLDAYYEKAAVGWTSRVPRRFKAYAEWLKPGGVMVLNPYHVVQNGVYDLGNILTPEGFRDLTKDNEEINVLLQKRFSENIFRGNYGVTMDVWRKGPGIDLAMTSPGDPLKRMASQLHEKLSVENSFFMQLSDHRSLPVVLDAGPDTEGRFFSKSLVRVYPFSKDDKVAQQEGLKLFPELAPVYHELKLRDSLIPPSGTIGQLTFYVIINPKEGPVLVFEENQPSKGIRDIQSKRDLGPYLIWIEAVQKYIISLAKKVGVRKIYALPGGGETMKFIKTSDKNFRLSYEKPYVNKPHWRLAKVDASAVYPWKHPGQEIDVWEYIDQAMSTDDEIIERLNREVYGDFSKLELFANAAYYNVMQVFGNTVVDKNGDGILILAKSGAGKSILTTEILKRHKEFKFVEDDGGILSVQEGRLFAGPLPPGRWEGQEKIALGQKGTQVKARPS